MQGRSVSRALCQVIIRVQNLSLLTNKKSGDLKTPPLTHKCDRDRLPKMALKKEEFEKIVRGYTHLVIDILGNLRLIEIYE